MELMIVIFIIALLAAIAIHKFADLVRRSNEGATKGNLGSIRSAMTVYYGDLAGSYPRQIVDLTSNGKYLSIVPAVKTPYYHDNSSAENDASAAGDSGRWFFDNGPSDQNYGTVLVDCSHTDSSGNSWNAY